MLLFGFLAACKLMELRSASDEGELRFPVGELAFVGMLFAAYWTLVLSEADKKAWLQWIRQPEAIVTSTTDERVFFSSLPHPGVVKQTMGSSHGLEAEQ